MKAYLKKLWRKIRTWNPKWFINPFYSPSLAFIEGHWVGVDMASGKDHTVRALFENGVIIIKEFNDEWKELGPSPIDDGFEAIMRACDERIAQISKFHLNFLSDHFWEAEMIEKSEA